MKEIFIITEANPKIGFGHLSRCLNIANYFQIVDIDVIFVIGQKTDKTFLDLIKNFKTADEVEFIKFLREKKDFQKVLVDVKDNHFSSSVIKLLDEHDQVFAIDYISNDSEKFTKIFLPPAAYSVARSLNSKYLIGWEWIPFSKSIFEKYEKNHESESDYVLLTFGGSDADSLSFQISEYLGKKFPHIRFKLILGPFCTLSWCEKVKSELKNFSNIEILEGLTDISEQILNAHKIVGTYGQTYYEAKLFKKPYAAIFRNSSEVAELDNFECTKNDLFFSMLNLRDSEGHLDIRFSSQISEFIMNASPSVDLSLELNGSERIARYISEYEKI